MIAMTLSSPDDCTQYNGIIMCTVLYVTMAEPTILCTKSFEIRRPLPSMAFSLQPMYFRDMSQNVPGSPILKISSKHNETLLHMLHTEVRILTVYAKYVAPPTKSMSSMAAKMLEREQ